MIWVIRLHVRFKKVNKHHSWHLCSVVDFHTLLRDCSSQVVIVSWVNIVGKQMCFSMLLFLHDTTLGTRGQALFTFSTFSSAHVFWHHSCWLTSSTSCNNSVINVTCCFNHSIDAKKTLCSRPLWQGVPGGPKRGSGGGLFWPLFWPYFLTIFWQIFWKIKNIKKISNFSEKWPGAENDVFSKTASLSNR